MTSERHKWTRWIIGIAKLALCALLCWFIYAAFASGSQSLNGHSWHVEPWWLVLSGVLYLVGCLPSAIFWYVVLLRTGQKVKFGESLRAYYISQLGKYVPGKWMVILLRRTCCASGAWSTPWWPPACFSRRSPCWP